VWRSSVKIERLKFDVGNKDYEYKHTIDSIQKSAQQIKIVNDSLLKRSIIKEMAIVLLENKLNDNPVEKKTKNENKKVTKFTPTTRSLYVDSLLRAEGIR
jgi:beta-glucosidase-like glycosyl hydrolase